jgi:O-succinylbenzoate synthase
MGNEQATNQQKLTAVPITQPSLAVSASSEPGQVVVNIKNENQNYNTNRPKDPTDCTHYVGKELTDRMLSLTNNDFNKNLIGLNDNARERFIYNLTCDELDTIARRYDVQRLVNAWGREKTQQFFNYVSQQRNKKARREFIDTLTNLARH